MVDKLLIWLSIWWFLQVLKSNGVLLLFASMSTCLNLTRDLFTIGSWAVSNVAFDNISDHFWRSWIVMRSYLTLHNRQVILGILLHLFQIHWNFRLSQIILRYLKLAIGADDKIQSLVIDGANWATLRISVFSLFLMLESLVNGLLMSFAFITIT